MPVASAALGIGYRLIKGIGQDQKADEVKVPDADYTVSPYAKSILGRATQMLNAPAPGSTQAVNEVYGNQSNTTGAIGRNAKSGSQALALITGAQGETNKAFGGLEKENEEYNNAAVNNWNSANQTMIGEGDKVYQDAVRKQMLAISAKNALRQSGMQNINGAFNDVATQAAMNQNQKLIAKLYGGRPAVSSYSSGGGGGTSAYDGSSPDVGDGGDWDLQTGSNNV